MPAAKYFGFGILSYLLNLSVFILAYLLGRCGFSFRFRLAIVKMLRKMNPDMQGFKRRYYKNIALLCLAPVWSIAIYLFGMHFLGSAVRMIFMVIGPILPVLGYFGIIREIPDGI